MDHPFVEAWRRGETHVNEGIGKTHTGLEYIRAFLIENIFDLFGSPHSIWFLVK